MTETQIEVTQDDVRAAVELWEKVSLGQPMSCSWAEAFARHRLTTRTDATPVARKQFPILGSRGAKIDLQLVEDHGKQAYSNHSQTVTRLAERGGLSWCELHAVLNNRPWQKMDENTAIAECRAIEVLYLGAFNPPATDVAALVEAAKIVKLWALLDDIDTLDDACRGDDSLFRKLARDVQQKRFAIVSGEEWDATRIATCTDATPAAEIAKRVATLAHLTKGQP